MISDYSKLMDNLEDLILVENEKRAIIKLPESLTCKPIISEQTLNFFDKLEEKGYYLQAKMLQTKKYDYYLGIFPYAAEVEISFMFSKEVDCDEV